MKLVRRCILLLPFFMATCALGATTYTTRAGIPKPADSDTGWGSTWRSAMDVVDSSVCVLNSTQTLTGTLTLYKTPTVPGLIFTDLTSGATTQASITELYANKNSLAIYAPQGISLGSVAGNPFNGAVDVVVTGSHGGSYVGAYGVEGSSNDATVTYSGFIGTTSVDANTLWSLPKKDGTANQLIVTDGSAHLSFTSTLSSTTFTGGAAHWSLPVATINTLISGTTGQEVWCNNCTANGAKGTPCYSSGTTTTLQFILSTGTLCR